MGNGSDSYSLKVQLSLGYEAAIEQTTAALKTEGFGVLTNVDMAGTLKQKLGVEMRRYAILGACNPPLAHRAVQSQLDVGLLLPCNVIVYEDGDGCVVQILDPLKMMEMIPNPALMEVAREARSRMEKVIAVLGESDG